MICLDTTHKSSVGGKRAAACKTSTMPVNFINPHLTNTRIIYAIQIGEMVEIHVTVNSFDTVIGKLINRYVCIQPKLYLYLY